jgi:hypothetical protein
MNSPHPLPLSLPLPPWHHVGASAWYQAGVGWCPRVAVHIARLGVLSSGGLARERANRYSFHVCPHQLHICLPNSINYLYCLVLLPDISQPTHWRWSSRADLLPWVSPSDLQAIPLKDSQVLGPISLLLPAPLSFSGDSGASSPFTCNQILSALVLRPACTSDRNSTWRRFKRSQCPGCTLTRVPGLGPRY